jgi:hypothetical protein
MKKMQICIEQASFVLLIKSFSKSLKCVLFSLTYRLRDSVILRNAVFMERFSIRHLIIIIIIIIIYSASIIYGVRHIPVSMGRKLAYYL